MNVKNHALMRWAQRKYDYYIIDDNTFKVWRRTNEDKIPEIEKEVLEVFESAELDITTEKSNYKVNRKHGWVFVYEAQNIVTCYKLQYKGLSEEVSKSIIELLIQEYENITPEYNKLKEKLSEEESLLQSRNEQIEEDIKILNRKINYWQQEQRLLNEEFKLKKDELDIKRIELEMLANKIVKPSYFLK